MQQERLEPLEEQVDLASLAERVNLESLGPLVRQATSVPQGPQGRRAWREKLGSLRVERQAMKALRAPLEMALEILVPQASGALPAPPPEEQLGQSQVQAVHWAQPEEVPQPAQRASAAKQAPQ